MSIIGYFGSSPHYQVINSSGQVNLPLLCCFAYYLPSDVTNATGDGTVWKLGTTTALTKLFDQSNSMNTNGTFTAPETGIYSFTVMMRIANIGVQFTDADLIITTTNNTYEYSGGNIGATHAGDDDVSLSYSVMVAMSVNDTASTSIAVSGGTKVATIVGGLTPIKTFIAGRLIA